MPACPICKRTAARKSDNGAFPFCSPRCKQVDLGKWLDEKYSVAGDPAAMDDEGQGFAERPKLEDA